MNSAQRLKLRKFAALLNILYYGWRPIVVPILFTLFCARSIGRRSLPTTLKSSLIRFLAGSTLLLQLWRIYKDRFSWTWRSPLASVTDGKKMPPEGLIRYRALTNNDENDATRARRWQHMEKVLDAANVSYAAPAWCYLGGDLTTLLPTFFHPHAPPGWTRRRTVDDVDLDFLFPRESTATIGASTNLAILLPGVGGGSNSGYVIDVANEFVRNGWTVCVVLARGMGNSKVECVTQIYNPSLDMDIIHRAIKMVCSEYDNAVLVGFSLGGIGVNRYMSYFNQGGNSIPSNILGGLSFSGAFKVDFLREARYENVYQTYFVPTILENVIEKHEPQLRNLLGREAYGFLIESSTYRDLHQHFFHHWNQETDSEKQQFAYWKKEMESDTYRHAIDRPLLLISAHDDPLHFVEHIGAESDSASNPYVAYYLTKVGGHVAWSEFPREPMGRFSWITRTSVNFANALLTHSGLRFVDENL